jgi:hypothetical protein
MVRPPHPTRQPGDKSEPNRWLHLLLVLDLELGNQESAVDSTTEHGLPKGCWKASKMSTVSPNYANVST